MKLAIRDLFERAEPQLSPETRRGLEELDGEVDEVRQARGRAVVTFGDCHEYSGSGALQKLAGCFDRLGPADEYAPAVAALLAEAALADQAFQVILARNDSLRKAGESGDASLGLRVRAALGDAGVPGAWDELIKEAELFRFPAAEGTYVCLRGGRWCAWNGQLDKAEALYRWAMKLGSEANLDLDIENALWSLSALYTLGDPSQELFETNRMALAIEGTLSFLKINSRTRHRSYQHIVNEELPAAHLWARYHLLESVRSGSLMDELESHSMLARIYGQSGELISALEHAVLGGSLGRVKELAPRTGDWPDSLPDMAGSKAPWVRHAAFSAIEHAGDFAPPGVARSLVSNLVHQLDADSLDIRAVPGLLNALGAIIIKATDGDVRKLMPFLEEVATREPGTYRLTNPGVMTLAARLYRFRPAFRQQAASILGEMAIGTYTGAWSRAVDECGDDTGELLDALERIAERENLDFARPLSALGHLNASTRKLWGQRLSFVADALAGEAHGRLQAINAELGDVEMRLENLYQALETKQLPMEVLSPRILALKGRHDQLTAALEEAEGKLEQRRMDLPTSDEIGGYVADFREFLGSGTFPERKALLRNFVEGIEIMGEEATLTYTIPMPQDGVIQEPASVLDFVQSGPPKRTRTP